MIMPWTTHLRRLIARSDETANDGFEGRRSEEGRPLTVRPWKDGSRKHVLWRGGADLVYLKRRLRCEVFHRVQKRKEAMSEAS